MKTPRTDIAFIDLVAQQKVIRKRVEKRLTDVLDHGRYIAGPEIEELEKTLSAKVGARHCIACSSGTDALIIPMLGMELSRGDAVFLPAFTYNATANAVLLAGGVPVFVDIDPQTLNLSPTDLRARVLEARANGLTPRLVLAVDLFGVPADYPAIRDVAEEFDLLVLGDAAQSFGGRQDGKWVGSLAWATATSFFPGKAMGGYGDGGAIYTDDDHVAELCESIRWHGTDAQRGESVRIGLNGRMSSFQAGVLLEKEAIFWDELDRRKKIAAVYDERLKDHCTHQAIPASSESGYGYYTVLVDNRDAVQQSLKAAGVPTAIYYKMPLHKMKAFAPYPPYGPLKNSEAAADRVLSLPMHPYLTDEQANYICDAFAEAVEQA